MLPFTLLEPRRLISPGQAAQLLVRCMHGLSEVTHTRPLHLRRKLLLHPPSILHLDRVLRRQTPPLLGFPRSVLLLLDCAAPAVVAPLAPLALRLGRELPQRLEAH